MNKHLRSRSVQTALQFALCVGLLAGCSMPAAQPSASNGTLSQPLSARSKATMEAISLQLEHIAIADALIARLPALAANPPHPNDPEHCAAVAEAAKNMRTRAASTLAAFGLHIPSPGEITTPESHAISAADLQAVENLYAESAVTLQRGVVRAALAAGADDAEPRADLALLVRLGGVTVNVPHSSTAGTGNKGNLPRVASSKAGQQAGDKNNAEDPSDKRRGFATHPGYVPK